MLAKHLFSELAEDDNLGNDNGGHERESGKGDGKNLDVEDDQALPGVAGEAAPGVVHGGVALAADDAGLDLALEGTVKGDDGVCLLGDEGGLDADEDDVGGDDDDDLEGDADEGDDDALPGVGALRLGDDRVGLAELEVGEVEAEGPADGDGDPGGDLLCEPVGGDGLRGGVKGALEGREALPEVVGARGGDDDVDPDGGELDEGEGGEEGREGGEDVREEGGEDAKEEVGREGLDKVDAEAAEV